MELPGPGVVAASATQGGLPGEAVTEHERRRRCLSGARESSQPVVAAGARRAAGDVPQEVGGRLATSVLGGLQACGQGKCRAVGHTACNLPVR